MVASSVAATLMLTTAGLTRLQKSTLDEAGGGCQPLPEARVLPPPPLPPLLPAPRVQLELSAQRGFRADRGASRVGKLWRGEPGARRFWEHRLEDAAIWVAGGAGGVEEEEGEGGEELL